MPSKYHKKPKAPPDHPRFFPEVADADLPDGWELLVQPEERERYQFTAERVAKNEKRYQAIVQCLGMNMSAHDISRLLHVHHRVVAAIVEREKIAIDALKNSTGELMLKASALSVRSYLVDLLGGNVDAKTKAIAAGIFSQNGMLLTGQPTAILETRTNTNLSVEAVNGFWDRVKRLKGASAAPAEAAANAPASEVGREAGSIEIQSTEEVGKGQ